MQWATEYSTYYDEENDNGMDYNDDILWIIIIMISVAAVC